MRLLSLLAASGLAMAQDEIPFPQDDPPPPLDEPPLDDPPVELPPVEEPIDLEPVEIPEWPSGTAYTICDRRIGAAGGLAPGGRDWDLTTPGVVAFTASPLLTHQCTRFGSGRSAFGLAVEVFPIYQHSYRRLGQRAPLLGLVSWRWGRTYAEDRHVVGAQFVTNLVAAGFGVFWRWSDPHPGFVPGLDVSLDVLPAAGPDLRLTVTGQLHRAAVNGGPPEPEAEEWAPPAPFDPSLGFEMGTVIGLRAELEHRSGFALVARVGENTSWAQDVVLQPIGIGALGVPIGDSLRVDAGAAYTRHDGAWIPAGAAAVTLGDGITRLHLGALIASFRTGGYRSPDLAWSFVW